MTKKSIETETCLRLIFNVSRRSRGYLSECTSNAPHHDINTVHRRYCTYFLPCTGCARRKWGARIKNTWLGGRTLCPTTRRTRANQVVMTDGRQTRPALVSAATATASAAGTIVSPPVSSSCRIRTVIVGADRGPFLTNGNRNGQITEHIGRPATRTARGAYTHTRLRPTHLGAAKRRRRLRRRAQEEKCLSDTRTR